MPRPGDVILRGDDWRGTAKGEELESDFAAVGVAVHYFPYTMHTSRTQLRKALATLDSPRQLAAAGSPQS